MLAKTFGARLCMQFSVFNTSKDIITKRRNMSSITVASLPRISREELSSKLRSAPATMSSDSPIAIIDVRDSDWIGGHIRGARNVPSSTLDYKVPELVRMLKDKEEVVFHCALSQQRGPSAALRYIRERNRLLGTDEGKEGADSGINQKVYLLEGGFVKWQEKYGEDRQLTEDYQKDIWEMGY